jgi:hypothetical protein
MMPHMENSTPGTFTSCTNYYVYNINLSLGCMCQVYVKDKQILCLDLGPIPMYFIMYSYA